ncbi:MAG: hypothetical protein KF712_14015 [Akkermansiaceae bacterium]|nr:hypothetical protein [Akkermansiaceae bacterium]
MFPPTVLGQRTTMNGKPVIHRPAKTVLTIPSPEFGEKLLCDSAVLNLGDACAFSCEFCYVSSIMYKLDKELIEEHLKRPCKPADFSKVTIRRQDAIKLLRSQLLDAKGRPIYPHGDDNRVVFMSSLVDPAANMELLRETAEACNLILNHTSWQIRLLSKSNLLYKLVADNLIPEKFHQRLIFGFSTGTLDDRVARAIETGTPLVSKRLEALRWLQDRGLRTYGMICPSLPQANYDEFSRQVCEAIRADRCEHVWAEVLNVRGQSLTRCIDSLRSAGLAQVANQLSEVGGTGNTETWELYARDTFEAHARHVPAGKLRFLQYVTKSSTDWWDQQRGRGGIPLGAAARRHAENSAPSTPEPKLDQEDEAYLKARERIVRAAIKSSVAAARALHEIHTYKDGLLWKKDHPTFEAYCRVRWNYGKSHAYRLKECGGFIGEIESAGGSPLPLSEGQIRPLLQLPPQNRVECWEKITAGHKPEELTARMIADDVGKFAASRNIDIDRHRQQPEPSQRATKILDQLRKVAAGMERGNDIGKLIDRIHGLMVE